MSSRYCPYCDSFLMLGPGNRCRECGATTKYTSDAEDIIREATLDFVREHQEMRRKLEAAHVLRRGVDTPPSDLSRPKPVTRPPVGPPQVNPDPEEDEDPPEAQDPKGDEDDREAVPEVDSSELQTICGARKKGGGICPNPPMKGRTRCAQHGGKSPRGIKSASFIHGGDSDFLADSLERIGVDLDERLNSPSLVDPRRPLAALEHVLGKRAEMLADHDGREFRLTIASAIRDIDAALEEDDDKKVLHALKRAKNIAKRGLESIKQLDAVSSAATNLVKGQAAYHKAAVANGRAISPEEFAGALMRIATIIEEEADLVTADRVLERTDAELLGGAMGLSGRGDQEEAPG